jgi:alpha-glucoside transport system permease protein
MFAARAKPGGDPMTASTKTVKQTSRTDPRAILSSAPLWITLVLIGFLWTLPTAGLLVSSLRPAADIQTTGWWTAITHPFAETTRWTLDNYEQVLTAEGMGNAFLNSLLVTIPSVVIPITIAAFAAYAFAWLDFPLRGFFFAIVVALMVVPLQTALIPILRDYVKLDLNGTYLGVWLFHTGFGLPLAIFLLFGYISSLPGEIIESAHIDGASPFTTFTRLVLPLSVPVIASFAIFQFLWVWNDLLVALVFLGTGREVMVVTQQLSALVGERGQDWHILTAGAFITMIVPLLVFFSLQRYFVRGLTAGSVKG